MSYYVCLKKHGETVQVKKHADGGTYVVGGTTDAELNVTYNYSRHFRVLDLDGVTAYDTIPLLKILVEKFGTERDDDYWKPTEGNVGYMLSILLKWASKYPDAVWEVN